MRSAKSAVKHVLSYHSKTAFIAKNRLYHLLAPFFPPRPDNTRIGRRPTLRGERRSTARRIASEEAAPSSISRAAPRSSFQGVVCWSVTQPTDAQRNPAPRREGTRPRTGAAMGIRTALPVTLRRRPSHRPSHRDDAHPKRYCERFKSSQRRASATSAGGAAQARRVR